MSEKIVVALGGNAILKADEKGTVLAQRENVRVVCEMVADLIEEGYHVVITHGNGPQVGAMLLQNELAHDTVPVMPLDICGAATQGQIGYMMQQIIGNIMRKRNHPIPVVSVITQVVVAADDAAFQNPTKPIGAYYSAAEAEFLAQEKSWVFAHDSARGGFRRVVPSPMPLRIVENNAIVALLSAGCLVIASGGGGIPVVEHESELLGVEAVIDKDLASELLAQDVRADILLIITDVSYAALNYNTAKQTNLRSISLAQARKYTAEGHFKAGSMEPKMMSAIKFLESGGGKSIITSFDLALEALAGKAGTIITKN